MTQHFLTGTVGSPLFQAVLGTWRKLFFYSIPPPSEVRISTCKDQRGGEVHSRFAASDPEPRITAFQILGVSMLSALRQLGNKVVQ